MNTKKLVPQLLSAAAISLVLSACGNTLSPVPEGTVMHITSKESPSRTPSVSSAPTKPLLPAAAHLETITTYDRSYGFEVCRSVKQEITRVTMLLSTDASLDADGTDLLNYMNDLYELWDVCLDLKLS